MKRIIRFVFAMLVINLISPLQSGAQQKEVSPGKLFGPEMEQAALKFVKTYHPSKVEEFKHIKMGEPDHYAVIIMEIWRRTEELNMLKKEDPQHYDLEIRQEILEEKTSVLAESYQNARNEKERQNIKQQLETAISEQFDIREQIKESEVKKMEAELQRVKEQLRQRKAHKSEIVSRRVKELLNASIGLGWE